MLYDAHLITPTSLLHHHWPYTSVKAQASEKHHHLPMKGQVYRGNSRGLRGAHGRSLTWLKCLLPAAQLPS